MAASTIGTNVVADEQELANLLNKVVGALDNSFKTTKNNHYQKMMERLAKYVGAGGKLSYDLVDRQYVQEIEDNLKARGIDYMLIPADNGDVGIAVKDSDKDILELIEEQVLSLSVQYTREFHDMDKFLDNIKHNPQMKGLDIPVLSCQDKTMRSILQQSLYESRIVSCYSENTDKLCVAPNKVFNTEGDLADGLLRASFDIARCEASPDYKEGKIAQFKYDRETLNTFIARAKKGEVNLHITSLTRSSHTEIKLNEYGDILVKRENDKDYKKILSSEDLSNFDNTTIYAHLSRYTSEIRDMSLMKELEFDKFTNKNFNLDEAGLRESVKIRPEYNENAKMYSRLGKDIDILTSKIISETNEYLAENHNLELMNPQKAFNLKRNRIVELLNNPYMSPAVQDFLNNNKNIPISIKEDLIKKACASIDNVLGNSKDDIDIDFVKVRQLEEVFDRQKQKENEKDKAKENTNTKEENEPTQDVE